MDSGDIVPAYEVARESTRIRPRAWNHSAAASSASIRVIRGPAVKLTAIGILIGILGALGLSQIVASLLFNVGKYDPTTLITVGALLGSTALLASYLPARRATNLNPIAVLRCE